MSQKIRAWLIFSASRQQFRVYVRRPNLALDEVAWALVLDVPSPWGQVMPAPELSMPEIPSALTATLEPAPVMEMLPTDNSWLVVE